MNKDDIAEVFPGNDPTKWNDGSWPPRLKVQRWRDLYLAALTGSASASVLADGLAERAMEIADWALRREIEQRGGW
jgi:hypothetical protein